jgi:hypothetical protein
LATRDVKRFAGRSALAGIVAIFLAPLVMVLWLAFEPGLRFGHWERLAELPQMLLGYVVVLYIGFPFLLLSGFAYAAITLVLRLRGRLNWMTSAVAGALIGAAAISAFASTLSGAGTTGRDMMLFGLLGAITTLIAHGLVLRQPRKSAPAAQPRGGDDTMRETSG